jgi:tight adherence protein C
MSIWALVGVLFAVVIGAGALVWVGIRNPQQADERILQDRLEVLNQELSKRGEQLDLEKIELSQPFKERIIYPIARTLGELAIRFTPQNALNSVARRLELAGSPPGLEPTIFLALQFIGMVFFGGVVLLVFSLGSLKWPFGRVVIFTLVFAMIGFFFPQLWLGSKIARRQKGIRRAMPDALDLLTICVEAGLGFDMAMQKVSEKWQTELSLAFARVLQEINLGKLRREALRDMAERIGINEMTSFVAAVIQSEQLGVSMAKVLRIQSDQMRTRRRQMAEEEAHKAPIKMLLPMGLLIFPSLMIVLLTPAGLKLFHSALGGMF